MWKNEVIAKEHIEDFNRIRIILTSIKAPFSEKILKELLKEYNIISNSIFIGELRKSGVLKVERKMLRFSEDKPVHYNQLQEIYSRYQKKVNEYNQRARDKKKCNKISENKDEQEEIANAINFLKSKGFRIVYC